MDESPAYQTLNWNVADGVAHIELSRPDRLNALSKAMLLEINRAMDAAESDPDVRSIVLSGAGKGFSSGFDLKEQIGRAHV